MDDLWILKETQKFSINPPPTEPLETMPMSITFLKQNQKLSSKVAEY